MSNWYYEISHVENCTLRLSLSVGWPTRRQAWLHGVSAYVLRPRNWGRKIRVAAVQYGGIEGLSHLHGEEVAAYVD